MTLDVAQYERLPGIGKAIVDLDRQIGNGLGERVLSIEEARRIRSLIVERDDLVRAADKTYGCKLGGDGAARS